MVAAGQAQVIESSLSPIGRWRADVVATECIPVEGTEGRQVEQLRIVQVDRGTERVIESQLLVCGGALGAYGLSGLFWSPNSQAFYYTTAREGVPDGSGGLCWNRPLIRLDVVRGTTERLGEIWARSPQGTTLALWQEGDLILWSLDDSEIARSRTVIPEADVCQIAWSPDGEALAYVQSACPLCVPVGFAVVRLDLGELSHTVVLELEDENHLPTIAWDVPGQIRLVSYGQEERAFDFDTGELKPIQ